MPATTTVGVRYMIDDVAPAFAAVSRDGVRLLLSGPTSSGRRAMPDGTRPVPGGWNRLHLQVADLAAEVDRLRAAGCRFRNDIITGPGELQFVIHDAGYKPLELFKHVKPAGGQPHGFLGVAGRRTPTP